MAANFISSEQHQRARRTGVWVAHAGTRFKLDGK